MAAPSGHAESRYLGIRDGQLWSRVFPKVVCPVALKYLRFSLGRSPLRGIPSTPRKDWRTVTDRNIANIIRQGRLEYGPDETKGLFHRR
jgi:hypothetical protein